MKGQKIPFCTHDDVMKLKMTDIEAIGIITYQADKINYDLIAEMEGFNYDGMVDDSNSYSLKKISRKDIKIEELEINFNKSKSTINRRLNELENINIGNEHIPLIYVNESDNDIVYEINHKTYDKYYTLIDKDVLRELLKINGTALKLYLVIKYHYEHNKSLGKPCILTLEHLADKVGLIDTKNITDILNSMEGTFIKRKMVYTRKLEVKNGKAHNNIHKHYEYEIIETFNDSMIPTKEIENDIDDDLPW